MAGSIRNFTIDFPYKKFGFQDNGQIPSWTRIFQLGFSRKPVPPQKVSFLSGCATYVAHPHASRARALVATNDCTKAVQCAITSATTTASDDPPGSMVDLGSLLEDGAARHLWPHGAAALREAGNGEIWPAPRPSARAYPSSKLTPLDFGAPWGGGQVILILILVRLSFTGCPLWPLALGPWPWQ
jgi:hypothetical protein